MKKIIGYKCPTDLFNGRVKKGTIYKIDNANTNDLYNTCGHTSDPSYGFSNLPKEIVQQWEPVYAEESKTLTLGDKGVEVKISRGKIEANGGRIPIKYLEKLQDTMWNTEKDGALNWRETNTEVNRNISFPFVKLGCTTFTKEEVKLVIDTYNELNS
jgi:hypothetical protein